MASRGVNWTRPGRASGLDFKRGHLSRMACEKPLIGTRRLSGPRRLIFERDMLPRISIVTPSFNQGRFLEETILSVLNQNYENLEYIIIDGGSSDDSVDIIRRYERHLACWISEPDRGQVHAINKGIERITGDMAAFINSDDVYLPGA